jgi:hypothetical protein
MKDYSKKLHDLKESSKSVFEGTIAYKAGKSAFKGDKDWNKQVSTGNLEDGLIFSNEYIKILPDQSVVFENGSTVEKVTTGYSSLAKIDWTDDNYNWLTKGVFTCKSMSSDKKGIWFVRGEWNGGGFKGHLMYDTKFNKGYFHRGLFRGGEWNVSPFYFINGTISTPGSILGMDDIKVFNQNKFNFNIIAVAPGHKITMQMQDGKAHEVTVLKRLDSKSSDFSFKIKGADDKDAIPATVSWKKIRENKGIDKGGFDKNTVLSNSNVPAMFEDIFGLDFSSPIVKVIVGTSTEYADEKIERPEKEKTPEELATTQQHYDLINAPFLGIQKLGGEYYNEKGLPVMNNVGRVYLHASNSEYLTQFENVVKNLNDKFLASDFSQLRDNLTNKIITGAPSGYPWLASLIGKDTTETNFEGTNFAGSLNRIEAFLKYFVAIIVDYAGKSKRQKGNTNTPNTAVQDLIKTNLKNYLGVKTTESAPAAQAAEAPSESEPINQIKEHKGIVDSLRNIISENLKHF